MPTKAALIRQLTEEVINLKQSPLYAYRLKNGYQPVMGEGSLDARVVFIGEAPSKKEAETGKPFCGASGKVLEAMLASVGLSREEVYITSVLNDRPPENRDPSPLEVELYAPFLLRQLAIIRPRVIATLGRYSMKVIMETFGLASELKPIGTLHGQPFEAKTDWGKITILPLYHPAVALYNGSRRSILMEDFKILKLLL